MTLESIHCKLHLLTFGMAFGLIHPTKCSCNSFTFSVRSKNKAQGKICQLPHMHTNKPSVSPEDSDVNIIHYFNTLDTHTHTPLHTHVFWEISFKKKTQKGNIFKKQVNLTCMNMPLIHWSYNYSLKLFKIAQSRVQWSDHLCKPILVSEVYHQFALLNKILLKLSLIWILSFKQLRIQPFMW